MKPGIHPDYRLVVFQDSSCGYAFLTRSTARTDGRPCGRTVLDTAGRVEEFHQRYGRRPGGSGS